MGQFNHLSICGGTAKIDRSTLCNDRMGSGAWANSLAELDEIVEHAWSLFTGGHVPAHRWWDYVELLPWVDEYWSTDEKTKSSKPKPVDETAYRTTLEELLNVRRTVCAKGEHHFARLSFETAPKNSQDAPRHFIQFLAIETLLHVDTFLEEMMHGRVAEAVAQLAFCHQTYATAIEEVRDLMGASASARKAARARHAPSQAAREVVERAYKAGKWPSMRRAAKALTPVAMEAMAKASEGRQRMSEENAENTVYKWIREINQQAGLRPETWDALRLPQT